MLSISTIIRFLLHRSTSGAASTGMTIDGISDTATKTPESHVEDVSSKTERLIAKSSAISPTALIIVPIIIIVKFLVQRPFFLILSITSFYGGALTPLPPLIFSILILAF